jgi:hypothetical protein
MALTSLKLSHIQLVFKQLVLLYSIRHEYDLPEQCGEQLLRMQLQAVDKFLQSGSRERVAGR